MASPVITKAQAVAGGKFRPLLLVLNTPHAWERGPLTLIGRNSQYAIAPANIELSAEERQLVSPLQGMSIRNSLLDYAARTWQSKVEVLG